MIEVAVIDYGVGNLLSVSRALEHCGVQVRITSDPSVILSAHKVILPGVGAFADGMAALQERGLDATVRQLSASGTPLMGICLGMQMLFDESDEFGTTAGLGLIPGRVVKIPEAGESSVPHKIPHIGWNELTLPAERTSWQGSSLSTIEPGEAVYFVHSFMGVPVSPSDRLANCLYDGIAIAAAVQRANVLGCQFHPEKSGSVGLRILNSFLQR